MNRQQSILLLLGVGLFCAARSHAQDTLKTLDNAPVALVAKKTVAQFPAPTFLENLVVDAGNTLFFTSLDEGKIYRLLPGGKPTVFATIAGQPAGLVLDGKGGLLVGGWARDKTPTIWSVSKSGRVEAVCQPSGAQFLNGFIHLIGQRYLIADSYAGVIWEFNAETKKASLWLKDPLFARADQKNPTPGVNGLRVYKKTLFVTNTQNHLLLRVPLRGDGKPAAAPVVVVKDINLDDFALDGKGNVYATTHIYNTVVRVAPDGTVTTVGKDVFGCTSAAFGHGKSGQTRLYVTTNGGMSAPPPQGVQPAEIVCLTVGEKSL